MSDTAKRTPPSGQNVNMRIPDDILERIDHSATTNGLSRTQYILSWLPETHQSNDETANNRHQRDHR
jgi:predicted DNA binding CopG/RHH family protein